MVRLRIFNAYRTIIGASLRILRILNSLRCKCALSIIQLPARGGICLGLTFRPLNFAGASMLDPEAFEVTQDRDGL